METDKQGFSYKDSDSKEKFDEDVFFLKCDTTKSRGRGTHIERAAELNKSSIG